MMSVLLVWLPVVLDICRQANPFGLAGCLSRTMPFRFELLLSGSS